MIRVLMLNYEYPPLGGGTGIANHYLLKEFSRKKDLQIDLLTSSPDNYCEEKFSPNIKIIRLNIGKKNHQLHHQTIINLIIYFIQSTIFTFKHRKDYDLIHAFSGLPGGVTAWLSGKPYLVSFRGAEEPGYETRRNLLLQFIKPLLKIIYGQAKSLDANSQYLKQLVFQSFPGLKIKLINNGVDTTQFFPTKKPINKPVILCTSRLAERKGVEYLIRAMPLVPRAKLQLVGAGKLESTLKQLVRKLHLSPRVKFLGIVPHDQLPPIYRQAKLFVLPSLSESQSNSLLEAVASGLPVVATNVGGNPELIGDQNGILVPPENSQALAEAIIKALNQSWPKIHHQQKFSWKQSAKEYFQLYSRLFFQYRDIAGHNDKR